MVGVFGFPALLPTFLSEWRLSNTEAGWIAGIFFGAYALSVPILVSLTDRIDARRVYVGGALFGRGIIGRVHGFGDGILVGTDPSRVGRRGARRNLHAGTAGSGGSIQRPPQITSRGALHRQLQPRHRRLVSAHR